jgi:hypothetical protein
MISLYRLRLKGSLRIKYSGVAWKFFRGSP